MRDRTVLVTGANQGIGKASAIALARMGARLVLVCRKGDKGRAAAAEIAAAGAAGVDLIVADLSSQAEVRRAAAEFKAKHDKLHVLLNNAGVLVTSRRTTIDGLEETFAINHLGYFLLTNLLLDVMKASAPARVVSVSSDAHRRGVMHWDDLEFKTHKYSAWGAYSQSKLANVLFTRELAQRLAGTDVTANCLHPGVVASGFGQTYGGAMRFVMKIMRPFLISPEDGAKTSVYLASSPEVAGVTGHYFARCAAAEPSRAAREDGAPARLWAISETMTGLEARSNAA